MRIIAFILLATLVVTNLTLARRLPPKEISGPFFNLQAFTNPAYSVYCGAGFVTFLGLYTVCDGTPGLRCTPLTISQVLTYIDVSASFVGIDENFSFYLVSIANAGSFVGRLAGGILADRYGMPHTLVYLDSSLTYI